MVQTRDLQSGGIHGIYNNLHFDTSGKEKFKNIQNHYLANTFGFKDRKKRGSIHSFCLEMIKYRLDRLIFGHSGKSGRFIQNVDFKV